MVICLCLELFFIWFVNKILINFKKSDVAEGGKRHL